VNKGHNNLTKGNIADRHLLSYSPASWSRGVHLGTPFGRKGGIVGVSDGTIRKSNDGFLYLRRSNQQRQQLGRKGLTDVSQILTRSQET